MSARAAGTTAEKGRAAEGEAARLLEREGYRIVARNVRRGGFEVDIVAWDGDVLCFVEVRSRRSARHGLPAETVDAKKQARLAAAAAIYLAEIGAPAPRCRFDVVTRLGSSAGAELELVRGAFEVAS